MNSPLAMLVMDISLEYELLLAMDLSLEYVIFWNFPGSPVVKTSPSSAGAAGLIPGQRAKIPHASGPKKPKQKTKAIL